MAKHEEETEGVPTSENDPQRSEFVAADVPKDEKVTDKDEARLEQHPAIVGQPGVEVAERTIDAEKPANTVVHTKTFVTPKATWGTEDQDAVHARNINAVRQAMVNQGLRPDADVKFAKAYDWPYDGGISLGLDYEVKATPAVIAEKFDDRHLVVAQSGHTATDQVAIDEQRVQLQRDNFAQLQEIGAVPTEKDPAKK